MLNGIYKLGKAIKIGNPIQIKWHWCYAWLSNDSMQKSQIAEKYDDFLTSQNGHFWTFDWEGTTKGKFPIETFSLLLLSSLQLPTENFRNSPC